MTVPPPPEHVPARNPLGRTWRAPFELRTWKETIHLLLNMPVGIAKLSLEPAETDHRRVLAVLRYLQDRG